MSAHLGRLALFLARGERIHRETQDRIDQGEGKRPPTLQEMLTKYREALPFRWYETQSKLVFLAQGLDWDPGRESPPIWVPKVLADAWYLEQALEAPLANPAPGSTSSPMPSYRTWLEREKARAKSIPDDRKETNPKTAIGDKKVPLVLCSPIAAAHWALGQFAGLCKYQAWNWRIAGVRSSTYISAIKRHLDGYTSGEELDPVDGSHHLGNIMACCAILLDAQAAGKLNDDRPPSVECRSTYEFVEKQMAVLREKYKHIEQKPFTIEDTVRPDAAA